MMKLTCKDINPDTRCEFEASGASASEVASMMMDHAKTNHYEDVSGMTDEEIIKMMEAKVHE